MFNITTIAETMASELTSAVQASVKATNQEIDNIMVEMADADIERARGHAEVRRKQQAAADLISDSLRQAEMIEDHYRERSREITARLNALRAPAAAASIIHSPDNVRALSAARQA
jgi:hypothetical protein